MKTMKSWMTTFAVLAMALCLGAFPAMADDVTDAINEGVSQYKAGNYSEAASQLDYAAQLIRQKKGGDLETMFPKPLSGWTAEDATSTAAGAAMFGGGVTAQRNYYKDGSNITINIMTDSPAMQGMMMMLSNPAFASSSGMKLDKVNGQRAMYEYDAANQTGEMTIVVNNKYLITINGDVVSLDEIKAYAGAIDFDKLAAMQ